jgi:hypothetical protein
LLRRWEGARKARSIHTGFSSADRGPVLDVADVLDEETSAAP